VYWKDIPPEKRGNVLYSFMFIKDKTRPDGTYERTKARLVCNGANQKEHLYDFISSATVGLLSVFLMLNIATKFRCKLRTFDIKGAFLHAQFKHSDEIIYIKISREVTAIWIIIDPEAAKFVDNKGELLLQLDKFIYGLKQAPFKWQELLTNVLIDLGYRKLINDDCVMIKTDGTLFSILCLHVDDILQVTNCDKMYDELRKGLMKRFGTITAHDNADSYLGMKMDQSKDRGTIKLTQEGLVQTVADRYPQKGNRKPTSPTAEDFLQEAPQGSAGANLTDQSEFLSIVMQLMYLARLTRPDILLPVTYLVTRTNKATVKDKMSVQHIIDYLRHTKSLGITIQCTTIQLYLRADASYGLHQDGKGHTGFILALGPNFSYVHARSGKQKLIAQSSTEAEIIAAVDCLKLGIWVRNLIAEMGICPMQQMISHQDNKSAKTLMEGPSKAKRSRHILMKFTYVKDMVKSGALHIDHVDTDILTPDILTKPKSGTVFAMHRTNMMG
jgi:hypothetical protein